MDRMGSDLIDLILSSNQDGQLHFGEFAAALHLTALRRQVAAGGFLCERVPHRFPQGSVDGRNPKQPPGAKTL